MKLITCIYKNTEQVAMVLNNEIVFINDILTQASLNPVKSMTSYIEEFSKNSKYFEVLRNAKINNTKTIPIDSVEILAPIPYPKRNIFCLGKNYFEHATEVKATRLQGNGIPTSPIYFSKTAFPAIANNREISFSRKVAQKVDYESELAVIIGKSGKDIDSTEAKSFVFGYTIINDISARDLQEKHKQWFKGKNLDTFCPMGPCIVTRDEFDFPPALDISCYINGEQRQHGNTGNLIFDLPTIISDLSKGTSLYPGDIISTGTPSGVGAGFEPPRFLKDGDRIECKIEGIGSLCNHVKEYE